MQDIATVVATFNKAIGFNYHASINRMHDKLPPSINVKRDESPQTTNDEIKIWTDEQGKVETFGFQPQGGQRFRLRGVNFLMPDDIHFSKFLEKLHIGSEKIEKQYIGPWER